MDINSIKEKIRKLLNLSGDNPSDAESFSALQKAQELMAMYKIERGDISDEEQKKCVKKKTMLSYGTRSSDHYIADLAEIIADNFCCIYYMSTVRGSRTHTICFMGMEDDVEIATEVLYVANRYIVQGYNRVYKDLSREYGADYVPAKYFNPAKTGYIKGYLKGLKLALESQKEKNQEWGLVLVVPQEAKNFFDSLNHVSYNPTCHTDHTYFNQGFNDGTQFHLDDKIGNRESSGNLTQ